MLGIVIFYDLGNVFYTILAFLPVMLKTFVKIYVLLFLFVNLYDFDSYFEAY